MKDVETIGYPITGQDKIISDTPNFRIAVGHSGYDNNPCIKLAIKSFEGKDMVVSEMHKAETISLIKGIIDALAEYS